MISYAKEVRSSSKRFRFEEGRRVPVQTQDDRCESREVQVCWQ